MKRVTVTFDVDIDDDDEAIAVVMQLVDDSPWWVDKDNIIIDRVCREVV